MYFWNSSFASTPTLTGLVMFKQARSHWKSAAAITSSTTGGERLVGGHATRKACNLLKVWEKHCQLNDNLKAYVDFSIHI